MPIFLYKPILISEHINCCFTEKITHTPFVLTPTCDKEKF